MKIIYRIKNGNFDSIGKVADNYVAQPDEYLSDIEHKKPFFNGSAVVESITQQEIDEKADYDIDRALTVQLNQYKKDGVAFLRKAGNFVRRKYNDADITQPQYKSIRVILQPALQPLADGDWDIAQDNLNAITPPTNANMLAIYTFVKDKVDAYVLAGNF